MTNNAFMLGFLTSILVGCAVLPMGKVAKDVEEAIEIAEVIEKEIEKDKS